MDKQEPSQPDVTPPSWADRFLEWYCAPELLDEIQEDLHEAFHRRRKKYSLRKARYLFIAEVLLFCKPSSFEKPVFTFNLINMHGMFGNYLKMAWRNTLKNRVFSTISRKTHTSSLTSWFPTFSGMDGEEAGVTIGIGNGLNIIHMSY